MSTLLHIIIIINAQIYNLSDHTVQADGFPACVKGNIAIQWEWSNFDPSQNPNPLTDYNYNTLHNWLRPRDEHVIQNVCQSFVRERLAIYVNYNTIFFLWLAQWSDPWADFDTQWLKTHRITQECAFWGLNDGRRHLEVQIFHKNAKIDLNVEFETYQLRVIDDWRHWRRYGASLRTNFRRPLPNAP